MLDQIQAERERYLEEREQLEIRWAAEISAIVDRVARVIAPLPVSSRWIDRISETGYPVTDAHFARCEQLFVDYRARTARIKETNR